MYSLFINSVLIDSSNDFDVLVQKRYLSILDFLKDGYTYANDSDAKEDNRNSVIELIKDDDVKKLSILWSGNTVEDTSENSIEKDNIEENADTIEDQNENTGLNLDDDNIEDTSKNEENNINNNETIIINDSNNLSDAVNEDVNQQNKSSNNINAIKNSIINAIVSALNTLESDSAFIPSKTFTRQIQNLLNNQEYISYKQQFFTSILAGKSEHEIIIPIKQDDNLINIYTFCYVLIVRGYQFNLSMDDEYNLHIQITW